MEIDVETTRPFRGRADTILIDQNDRHTGVGNTMSFRRHVDSNGIFPPRV